MNQPEATMCAAFIAAFTAFSSAGFVYLANEKAKRRERRQSINKDIFLAAAAEWGVAINSMENITREIWGDHRKGKKLHAKGWHHV